jgi:hypothetical protein
MSKDAEQALDQTLETGKPSEDPQVSELTSVGRTLRDAFAVEAPPAPRERAMFMEGAAATGKRGFFAGLLAPAIAVATLLIGAAILARGAAPGEGLYPVKEALRTVGLAPSEASEVQGLIDSGRDLLNEASSRLESSSAAAQALAIEAIGDLEAAEELLVELDPKDRGDPAGVIDRLEERAAGLIRRAGEALRPQPTPGPTPSPDDDRPGDDSSGPGSGDDDSSGPGSGDDDSSGPGSGDDDSSGPGSGDDTDTEDSSGPGSGSDGDGDNSGPSASSGSGSDGDDSGSGSSGSGSSGSG